MANDHQQAAQATTPETDSVTLGDAVKLLQASGPRKTSNLPAPGSVGPEMQGRYIPTLSLDPGNVTALEGYEAHSGYVQCALEAFSTCHVGLKALSDAREQVKKDTSKTEANQILLVAGEAEKLQNRMTRAMDSARTRLLDGIRSLDDSLSKPMTTAADSSISGELRALCRSMSDSQREKFVNEAMKDRDTKVLNAILGAPAALSGLSKQLLAHHTRQFHEMTQPEIAARLTVMRKALALVESRAGLILTEIPKALGARWDVVQQLRKTQSAGEAALLLINNPVQR